MGSLFSSLGVMKPAGFSSSSPAAPPHSSSFCPPLSLQTLSDPLHSWDGPVQDKTQCYKNFFRLNCRSMFLSFITLHVGPSTFIWSKDISESNCWISVKFAVDIKAVQRMRISLVWQNCQYVWAFELSLDLWVGMYASCQWYSGAV